MFVEVQHIEKYVIRVGWVPNETSRFIWIFCPYWNTVYALMPLALVVQLVSKFKNNPRIGVLKNNSAPIRHFHDEIFDRLVSLTNNWESETPVEDGGVNDKIQKKSSFFRKLGRFSIMDDYRLCFQLSMKKLIKIELINLRYFEITQKHE